LTEYFIGAGGWACFYVPGLKLRTIICPYMHMSKIDEFDEKTATVRVLLFLYKNPNSGITKVIRETRAGQKAIYSAIEFLMKCDLIKKSRSSTFL